jgi:hypothetical protein
MPFTGRLPFKTGPNLALYDEDEGPRVGIIALKEGPTLSLYAKDGDPFWHAP